MKIARYTAYGGPETIRLEEAPVPVPGPGEVLVRVRAAPVTAGDVRMRSGVVPRGLGLMVRLAIGVRGGLGSRRGGPLRARWRPLARAHRIAETFHKPGNLVVVMDQTPA